MLLIIFDADGKPSLKLFVFLNVNKIKIEIMFTTFYSAISCKISGTYQQQRTTSSALYTMNVELTIKRCSSPRRYVNQSSGSPLS